ncbi:MAG: hypothetical protein ACSLEY_02820 [Candidatus Saccharimonadales bacterium]
MKKIRFIVTGLVIAAAVMEFSFFGGVSVNAFDPTAAGCAADPTAAICQSNADDVDGFIKNLIRILLWAIGIISVIMIIVGGLLYVLSSGNPSNTKKAKDTILYAVIGLVVALLSYTIVNYVLGYL